MTEERMTEMDDNKGSVQLPSPGEVLRLGREDAGLSLETVATELNVAVSKVKSLECDDFQLLHSDTFVRGYLRSYAKLLKIDGEGLISCYEAYAGDSGPVDVNCQREAGADSSAASKNSSLKWLPLLALVSASAWYAYENIKAPISALPAVAVTDNSAVEIDAEPDALAIVVAASELENSEADLSVVDSSLAAESEEQGFSLGVATDAVAETVDVVSAEDSAPEAAALSGSDELGLDTLEFSFSDECWVEVTDAQNDVLLADVKQGGETVVLQGIAPFKVMLGNASSAALTFNGEVVEVQPESGRKTLKITVPSAQ